MQMSANRYILIIGIIVLSGSISAQDLRFSASAPAKVQVGQQFQYTITGNQQGNIQLPVTNDFEFIAGPKTSYSSSTRVINGRMTVETTATYTYIMRCRKPGEYIVPAATITIKKDTYKTNEVKINVVGQGSETSTKTSNEQQALYLKVLPSKTSVYVGEQFVSELKVYTSVNTRPTAGIKEVPYEGFYKHALEADKSSSREVINGKEYVTQVLQRHVLIPQKAGKLVIEPFESEWSIPQRVSRKRSGSAFDDLFNDPFNDPFFDRFQEVPTLITTKPVTIDVKPLPPDAPKGFTGGVGDLNFSATLSAQNVKVNDAISLVIKISGVGNISLIGAPKIDFPPDHDVYETTKSTKISTTGNRVSGTVTYEYPVVVRHAGNFRIAPVSFSWFDPKSKSYKTITTEEFHFTVEKGEAGDEPGQIYLPGLRGEEVENIGTDILDIKRTIPAFIPIGESPFNKTFYWITYGILLLVFLSLLFILPVYFRQKADVRLTRNRQANKIARNRLKIADRARRSNDNDRFFEETEKAIWGYLADKLNLELSTLSRNKISEVLNSVGVSVPVLEELFGIMDSCEFSRYAPSSEKADINDLYAASIKLINSLEQNIRVK